MDVELKQYLDGKFAELDGKLKSRFSELDVKFATKQDLERVETALLTEFHKMGLADGARVRTHTAAIRAIDLEYEALNERVQKLENPGQ